MKVITRFAPSPTGFLHIGSLRTALFNYLFSKQNKGKFVLRIEDTDQKRQVSGADTALIDVLHKVGLDFDNNKPIYQSSRLKKYQSEAQKLVKQNKAYYCFCSAERLEKLRREQQAKKQVPRYDGFCRNLSAADVKKQLDKPHVIRFAVPENFIVKVEDKVYGKISVHSKDLDDFVIIKSDGFPTYHLANVIDDHEMEITHVIRGEEWLPSLPRHILLYQAFGFEPPKFVHLPLLLNPDRSKLSKRQGDVSVEDFLKKGYLPEALINYIALLGWNPGTEQEIFDIKSLIKLFSLEQINKSGAVFDIQKLNWMNGQYIKSAVQSGGLKLSKLATLTQSYLKSHPERSSELLKLFGPRLDNLAQLQDVSVFLFKLPPYEKESLIFKKSDQKKCLSGLNSAYRSLEKVTESKWSETTIHDTLQSLIGDELTAGDVFWPVRVALSGLEKSPSPAEIANFLGKAESMSRLKRAIQKIS